MITAKSNDALIYLRLSDFRDEDDATFDARREELCELAADLGLNVPEGGIRIENDLNEDGKARGVSAYKTPLKVPTSSGLVTFRTNRPVFQQTVLDLQQGVARVMIVSDASRISRNERDGYDLLDAAKVSGASVVAPDDDGEPRYILTDGGSHHEVSSFKDRIHDARKYSDDVAAKARKGRRRWAGKSYHGGVRPYGYRVVGDTEEHHRNLVQDDAEARMMRRAADDILIGDVSLKAIVRELRAKVGDEPSPGDPYAGARTVSGAQWTPGTLKDVLLKAATAGLQVKRGELVKAPWHDQAVLDREMWEGLKRKLTDPARKTTTGNEPKWLLSVFATCGVVLDDGTVCGGKVKRGSAPGGGRSYVGLSCRHLCRAMGDPENLTSKPRGADDVIAQLVVERLSMSDAEDLLKPPDRPGVDVEALNKEKAEIAERKADQVELQALGILTTTELAKGARAANKRVAEIDELLAISGSAPDPLAEFRGKPADAVWMSLSLPRRRAVVQTLFESVVFVRVPPSGPRFNRDSVEAHWRAEAVPPPREAA